MYNNLKIINEPKILEKMGNIVIHYHGITQVDHVHFCQQFSAFYNKNGFMNFNSWNNYTEHLNDVNLIKFVIHILVHKVDRFQTI